MAGQDLTKVSDEIEAARLLRLRIVLGEVRTEIAVGDRASHRVDKGVTEHVTIGMGGETDGRVNRYPTQDESVTGDQSVQVVPDADPRTRKLITHPADPTAMMEPVNSDLAAETLTTRLLVADDAEASRTLGWEAFGFPAEVPAEPASLDRPGTTWYGAFRDDLLVGRMADRTYDSYFGGARIPTCGIAGVTVVAEERGAGALSPLFAATFAGAHERGAAISTLYPTAPRIYRKFGYELVGDFVTVSVRTDLLATARPAEGIRTRRATTADVEAIQSIYTRWATEQNGPLSRDGVSFPADAAKFLDPYNGVTVAIAEGGAIVGYVSWERGKGYGEEAAIEVTDLIGLTRDATRALLRSIGSFSSVAYTTRIDTSGDDLLRYELAGLQWQVRDSSPYMLKILDVPGAINPRTFAPALSTRLDFAVASDVCAWVNGSYRLEVGQGSALCTSQSSQDGERTFSPAGIALLYAGVQSSANLRMAGQLTGGSVDQDADWDSVFSGRQLHIRDYF